MYVCMCVCMYVCMYVCMNTDDLNYGNTTELYVCMYVCALYLLYITLTSTLT